MRSLILLLVAGLCLTAAPAKTRSRGGKGVRASMAKKRLQAGSRTRGRALPRRKTVLLARNLPQSAPAPASSPAAAPSGGSPIFHDPACSNFMAEKNKKNLVDCARVIFTNKPIHLLVPGTIVPGSSFAAGLVYETEKNTENWQNSFKASGGVTYRKFAAVEAKANFSRRSFIPGVRDRLRITPYARFRNLPRLDYYGLGLNTKKDDRTEFRRRDMALGVQLYNPLTPWLAVGANVESLWLRVANGNENDPAKNILSRFDAGTAPGIGGQSPHFLRYEAFINPHSPDRLPYQLDYKLGYTYNQDNATGQYSHARFEVDLKNDFKFPLPRTNHLLIRTHLATAKTGAGKQVPFYLMDTIGGWDIYNDPMLRSFPDYRFRDRSHMLYSAEYIYDVYKGFGIGGFYDTGTVAPRFGDLSFGKMRHSYGLGMALLRGDRPYFRAYLAFGGGEGVHPFWGLPKMF